MPYHEHDLCETPADDTVVWRYLDIPKLIDLMEQRSLWLARMDMLNDPREGRATEIEYRDLRGQKYGHELIGMNEGMRSEGCVSCWFEGKVESVAMWELYGSGGYSVAIRSTVGAIRTALRKAEAVVYISRMKYIDWNDHANWPGNAIGMALRKSHNYDHEHEVRLYAFRSSIGHVPGTPVPEAHFEEETTGVRVPIDTEALVQEVIVGPKDVDWVMQLTLRLLKRFDLQSRVRWSSLKPARHEY